MNRMKISFLGGAGSVTGSCYLMESAGVRFLLDCGMHQGSEEEEDLNRRPFAFSPHDVEFMILSHAHIDHSGRIPLLVRDGFSGPVFCTPPTADLGDILLRDSGNIHEMESRNAYEAALRREKEKEPGERQDVQVRPPLYTVEDAEKAVKSFRKVPYHKEFSPAPGVRVRFLDAGHLLGSAVVEIWLDGENPPRKLVFSGDLGMKDKPILRDPEFVEEADILLLESTYGARLHADMHKGIRDLIRIIEETSRRGGSVVIPSFAVGRTQELLYLLNIFYEDHPEYRKMLDPLKVFVDSPLAISATEIFTRHPEVFDRETRKRIEGGDKPLDFKNLILTSRKKASVEITRMEEPRIIIASSGMCEGGRILYHLQQHLPDPLASIVFVGYQAENTRGRQIVSGKPEVNLFGRDYPVRAHIHNLEGFSGHADQAMLLEWLGHMEKAPQHIFLVHGEDESKEALSAKIREDLGWDSRVAPQGETVEL